MHISSSRSDWKYRELAEILTRQPSRPATYIRRLHLIRAALRYRSPAVLFQKLVLIGLFYLNCDVSSPYHPSLWLSFRQSWCFPLRYLELTECPSLAAGSHQGSPGKAGQPLIPECCFTTHGTVSRGRPSSALLPTLTSGWRAQMVARSVRLLLSASSHSCYRQPNVASSLKWYIKKKERKRGRGCKWESPCYFCSWVFSHISEASFFKGTTLSDREHYPEKAGLISVN